ncbi:Y-family DNA polymerase [Caulobacter hibisci]|nr:HipA domain-containing protein [Caulobacter hibisci]
MRRAERRLAERSGRAVRALSESDHLLGVADETRLSALRFRRPGQKTFRAPIHDGVPAMIELGRLLSITERVLRDEETDEDLRLLFAPGSSLGGARPKASVIDQHGCLSIAEFPKETDEDSIELWEEIALRLADRAGIATPHHQLIEVAGKPVMLSRRFDRDDQARIAEYTDLIEPLSLDEAFLDVSENRRGLATATDTAREIRARILQTTGLTASAGVSYNKFLAKLASDQRKPNGQFVVPPGKGEASSRPCRSDGPTVSAR